MYWQCTDESLSPRRKQNHTTKFFTEVTQFYSFILSRRCLRRSGQSRREKNNKICVKIEFYFFSISSKNNVGGSVNHKIKKVWPKIWNSIQDNLKLKSSTCFKKQLKFLLSPVADLTNSYIDVQDYTTHFFSFLFYCFV